ncbi:type II toxin-antitoxin system RelE/ParE family toxin [Flavobacterium sp. HJJ]|uniref:type II toxin-antitoxin system RelE/ParE family toxin n=1 Tax=Flavobacterium sp. HJJ TaxID=2783792 RepID=UPI00188D91A8|nr:type II toxin-antitoxin system RelE/ParE family toxin [Flavobacterium sp. HJJ]MBF4472779.1 type II toxin-antitoxin system RelE/ParE family toxin [Flavobacterium sp. HJJ]
MYKIIILVRADLEVDEIIDYYELVSKGLGIKFNNEFDDYVETLKTFPFFEEKYNIVRTLPLKKFPYTIHFTVDENEKIVTIHAITSDYQDPNTTKLKF